jgi:hypothetical protein
LATTFIELRRTSPANARHDCRPFAVDAERKSIQDGRIVLSVPLVWRPTALWLLREQVERLHIRLTLRLGVSETQRRQATARYAWRASDQPR